MPVQFTAEGETRQAGQGQVTEFIDIQGRKIGVWDSQSVAAAREYVTKFQEAIAAGQAPPPALGGDVREKPTERNGKSYVNYNWSAPGARKGGYGGGGSAPDPFTAAASAAYSAVIGAFATDLCFGEGRETRPDKVSILTLMLDEQTRDTIKRAAWGYGIDIAAMAEALRSRGAKPAEKSAQPAAAPAATPAAPSTQPPADEEPF